MFSWELPLAFLLLPLPWLARRLLPPFSQPPPVAIRFPGYQQITSVIGRGKTGGPRLLIMLASITSWVMLLAAAAHPVWYGEPTSLPTKGRDLMLAVDISDSMRVDDMQISGRQVSRLDAVKSVVADFVRARRSDRIGLILFGQHSFVQTPLTFDHNTVTIQLDESAAGFAGSSTAIGDALALAIGELRHRPEDGRILILLTDGANTSGSEPLQAAKIASEAGIRVHTIGIGATTHLKTDITGAQIQINPSKDLDQMSLRQIATLTGGQYFRAHDPTEIAAVYREIDQLEPTPEPRSFRPQRSLLHWPLGFALLTGFIAWLAHRRGL